MFRIHAAEIVFIRSDTTLFILGNFRAVVAIQIGKIKVTDNNKTHVSTQVNFVCLHGSKSQIRLRGLYILAAYDALSPETLRSDKTKPLRRGKMKNRALSQPNTSVTDVFPSCCLQ